MTSTTTLFLAYVIMKLRHSTCTNNGILGEVVKKHVGGRWETGNFGVALASDSQVHAFVKGNGVTVKFHRHECYYEGHALDITLGYSGV